MALFTPLLGKLYKRVMLEGVLEVEMCVCLCASVELYLRLTLVILLISTITFSRTHPADNGGVKSDDNNNQGEVSK